jgi:hypothetical protein
MSITTQASIIVEAFIFQPSADSLAEFKPSGMELYSSLLKLKSEPVNLKISVALALHLHYQSCRLCDVSAEQELDEYRDLLSRLAQEFGLSMYCAYYNVQCLVEPVQLQTDLSQFITPLSLPEALVNILHRKVNTLTVPSIEALFKYAKCDVEAAKLVKNTCFVVYDLATSLIHSFLSGSYIDDRNIRKLFDSVQSDLKEDFKKLCLASFKHRPSAPSTSSSVKPGNLGRIAKGYLNPNWDWREDLVDPAVRYAYEYLRTDKPQDVRISNKEDLLECKGSLELTNFYWQYMNKVMGKMVGSSLITAATFPNILPDSIPSAHFDQNIKLNGAVQHPVEAPSPSFKDWSSFCLFMNETLRLLNHENQQKIDAVWMFRNKPDPITPGYGGFLFACGMVGLLKELPLVAIMDILKSANKTTQSALLFGLGLSYRGQFVDSIERVFSMHIRSHFLNTLKVQISADIQGAALLGYSFMHYNSCDRQVLKILFREFSRSSVAPQHDKTTTSYPPNFFVNAGIGIGMVSSGDMRGCLSTDQLDGLLSTANGFEGECDKEFAALLALMIGGLGTNDYALANCISINNHQLQIRPYLWFIKHLCRLCIEWPELVQLQTELIEDEYVLFNESAKYLYMAIRLRRDLQVTNRLMDALQALRQLNITTQDGLAYKKRRAALHFATDCCLLSLSLLNNGTANPAVLRQLRLHFSSPLDYNFGRSLTHSTALGLLCMQDLAVDFDNHYSVACLLVSVLPVWAREFTDQSLYFLPLRYLWRQSCVMKPHSNTSSSNDKGQIQLLTGCRAVCDHAVFMALTHNSCPYTPQQLADLFTSTA